MTLNPHKIKNNVIIASLKSKAMGKLMNRIPDSRLLISSLPGSALRTHDESLGKPRDVNKRSQSDFNKRSVYNTNPCLVNLISKDTHLVVTLSSQASVFNKHSQSHAL